MGKKISDVFNERKKMQVQLPPQETGPIRRKKKPVEEEEPVVVAPVVEVESAPPVVEEELLEAPEEIVEVESAPPLEEVDGPQLAGKDKVRDEFKEKDKKPKRRNQKKNPQRKISDVFNERKKMQVQLPPQETGPIRRKKKPVEEEEAAVEVPVVEVESAPPVVEEELLEAPEEIVEVECAPPLEEVDGPQLPGKDKVRDEFKEKDKKPKGEAEKIVIKPAVLKVKGKPEEEESSSEKK